MRQTSLAGMQALWPAWFTEPVAGLEVAVRSVERPCRCLGELTGVQNSECLPNDPWGKAPTSLNPAGERGSDVFSSAPTRAVPGAEASTPKTRVSLAQLLSAP